jgi:hypothetical protein
LRGLNTVERLQLPGLTPDLTISMGSGVSGLRYARDLQVQPGHAHTIAVVRGGGVAIFDDATARAISIDGNPLPIYVDWLQWSGTDTLYGDDSASTAIHTIAVDANGIGLVSSTPQGMQSYDFGRIHVDAGLIYSDNGRKIDPASGAVLGTYQIGDLNRIFSVVPDSVNRRVFALGLTEFEATSCGRSIWPRMLLSPTFLFTTLRRALPSRLV